MQSIPGFSGTVKLEPLTFNDWLTVVTAPKGLDSTGKGKVDITENLWIEDYPDPQDYLDNLLRFGANDDIGYYDNSTYNNLINQANVNGNASKRDAQYLTAEKLALKQGAWI